MHAIKKVEKKNSIWNIKLFTEYFFFMIVFIVYEKKTYIDFCVGDIYPEKND